MNNLTKIVDYDIYILYDITIEVLSINIYFGCICKQLVIIHDSEQLKSKKGYKSKEGRYGRLY